MKQGVLLRYKDLLPITPTTPLFTLGEGDTPLLHSEKMEKELGVGELYFKVEGCNPTGSFKDRGMVMAVAKALEEGTSALVCASTGNTSASAAAYGSRMGLKVIVLVPQGKIAQGKLAQAIVYGAQVVAIEGSFDDAFRVVQALAKRHPITLVNSLNPYRLEGQKTAAFEIVDYLGEAPDYLFIPVGNAGNITAYWKGFVEYRRLGKAQKAPRMMGFQAEGAAPIVRGHPITNPQTVASAIRIGDPAHWQNAVKAREESGGLIDMVSDDEIMGAYRRLGSEEGIFAEPASAASLAGLVKWREKLDLREKRVVCVMTGHGLKDPQAALSLSPTLPQFAPHLDMVEKALGWDRR
jgi:threonine synthase